jgi:hypothetical protein
VWSFGVAFKLKVKKIGYQCIGDYWLGGWVGKLLMNYLMGPLGFRT